MLIRMFWMFFLISTALAAVTDKHLASNEDAAFSFMHSFLSGTAESILQVQKLTQLDKNQIDRSGEMTPEEQSQLDDEDDLHGREHYGAPFMEPAEPGDTSLHKHEPDLTIIYPSTTGITPKTSRNRMEQNEQDDNLENDGPKDTAGSENAIGSKNTTGSDNLDGFQDTGNSTYSASNNAVGSTESLDSSNSTNSRTNQQSRYVSGSKQATSYTDNAEEATEYDMAEGRDMSEDIEYTSADSDDSTDRLPVLGSGMSTFIQDILPTGLPGTRMTEGPALPELRDKEFFQSQMQFSPDYNLRSAYFLSTPVKFESDPHEYRDPKYSADYKRLVYDPNAVDRKDQTIFGGVIGGLAGIFGFLLSKKIILTAVGLATLLALGLTGTNPFNLARNIARNFGLGFDLRVAVDGEDGHSENHIAMNGGTQGGSIQLATENSGPANSWQHWIHNLFRSQIAMLKSAADVMVDLQLMYLGNTLGVKAGGNGGDGSHGADVQVSFTPSSSRRRREGNGLGEVREIEGA